MHQYPEFFRMTEKLFQPIFNPKKKKIPHQKSEK